VFFRCKATNDGQVTSPDEAQQRIDETTAMTRRKPEKEKQRGRLRADIDLGVTAV
jgi:hypothetical protein